MTLINDAVSVSPCAGLSNTAPAITPFLATLTGATQTVHAAVGAWGVVDPRGSDAGYVVTVAASTPTVGGSASAAGTGASLTLTPATATAAAGNPAETGPVARPAQLLGTIPSTIASAPAGTGQGGWNFPADAGDAKSLAIVIPGDAGAGAFSSTLTFTTAPPAAS